MVFTHAAVPDKTPANDNQGVSIDSLIDFTPELREETNQGHREVTPGSQGGTNWPGGSYDPDTHMLYVFSQTAIVLPGIIENPDKTLRV